MWSTVTKQMSFNGAVAVAVGGSAPPLPLRGVFVDVYRTYIGSDGTRQFQRLNQASARTSTTGDFSFVNLAVPVEEQLLTPSDPPYTPFPFTNPASLPTLVFRVSADADVLLASVPAGTELAEVYDERNDVDAMWLMDNPARVRVPITATPVISVVIPEGDPEAMVIAGLVSPAASVPGSEFHFLRIGRAIRAEIGQLGDTRAEFANRAGYMTSTNLHAVPQPSFFPGVRDAPFAGQLHLGGKFGTDFETLPLADNLYYTVSFWNYGGSTASAFDETMLSGETAIEDPLFNKRYLTATDQWQTLNLGPFNGTIAADDTGTAVLGSAVSVYKRPPLQQPNEYWPFWDLIAIWNTGAAPNGLVVLTLQAYERVGGTDTAPDLKKLVMDPSNNAHLPLTIDNRQPALKLWDWQTGVARFTDDDVVATAGFDPCGDMPVTSPQADRNECILLKYSIEDGAGNPHPHVGHYSLGIVYTPRQVTGAPLETGLPLRNFLGGGLYDPISGSYTPGGPTPQFSVVNQESVLVPQALDGWPPEPGGDPTSMGSQCSQYALAVGASCSVRTVNGWSGAFGNPTLARHIIVRG